MIFLPTCLELHLCWLIIFSSVPLGLEKRWLKPVNYGSIYEYTPLFVVILYGYSRVFWLTLFLFLNFPEAVQFFAYQIGGYPSLYKFSSPPSGFNCLALSRMFFLVDAHDRLPTRWMSSKSVPDMVAPT